MPIAKAAILITVLMAAPSLALAEDHQKSSPPPCGWKGGSLPDPADTQRCLAERYKAPKPKAPSSGAPQPQPNTNGGSAGTE
jgi:hypothetical protein